MKHKFLTVVFCTAVLFIANAHVHAQDVVSVDAYQAMNAGRGDTTTHKWLDDYNRHVGLTWDSHIDLMANYLWRGTRCGGMSLQYNASVGYGGFFADMWWSLGASDWGFHQFSPEMDLSIGFNRWGLKVMFSYIYFFDRDENGKLLPYFDFRNSEGLGSRPSAELRAKYTVSSKLPLSIFVATRPCCRDGIYKTAEDEANGNLSRAWSTYFELGYDFILPWNLAVIARVGFTPWKSLYTNYLGDFAVNNINIELDKKWEVHQHMDVRAYVAFMANPWFMDYTYKQGKGITNDGLMFNAGVGVSFK